MDTALTRKKLIDIARRRQRAGAGSPREFLLARTVELEWPDLGEVWSGIAWAVVGAVATRLYMPERMTKDLDVAISATDAAVAATRLSAAGWKTVGFPTTGGASWLSPDNVMVDVLEGQAAWWPQALGEAKSNRDAQGLPILPLPCLVLMKFQAGRVNDLADITRMLGQADALSLNATRRVFEQLESAGLEDLESLIVLGHLELE